MTSWSTRARQRAREKKKEVREVQGASTWASRSRKADRARKKRVGTEPAWWKRLKGKR